jgi:predicted RNA-binding protein YlxR (DUF448 family)
MRNKKNTRMCAVCRERRNKEDLLRIVRLGGDKKETHIDPAGTMQGRGAYICRDDACIERARKTRALPKSLRCAVREELYEEMKKRLGEE